MRDEHGRYQPGTSGNPRGRRPASSFLKLVAAAEAAGAEVVIRLPARPVPPRARAEPAAPADDFPPRAA